MQNYTTITIPAPEPTSIKNFQSSHVQSSPAILRDNTQMVNNKVEDKTYGNDYLDFGMDKKNRKRMWEYDWTLLIPETHKQVGSMF
jgi:hypothetical protein